MQRRLHGASPPGASKAPPRRPRASPTPGRVPWPLPRLPRPRRRPPASPVAPLPHPPATAVWRGGGGALASLYHSIARSLHRADGPRPRVDLADAPAHTCARAVHASAYECGCGAGWSGTHQQCARARAAHLPGASPRALVRRLEPPPPSKRELEEDVVGRRVTSVAGGHAGHTSAGGGQQGRRRRWP